MSKEEKKKGSKKLQAFLKDKAPNAKRFKTLVAYTESSPDEQEERETFNEHADLIFGCFHEKWLEIEATPPTKKGKSHTAELISALGLLKKILLYLESMIKKKWKYDKIAPVIQQTLVSGNKHSIRLLGFELLLYFIQGLQTPSNENLDEQIVTFSCAVNLKPFIASVQAETNTHIKLKNFPPEGSYSISLIFNCTYVIQSAKEEATICPSGGEAPTKGDAVELLTFFLDFIQAKGENFQFWFLLFKEFYLSVFYPRIFQEMGVLYKGDDSGFTMYCPHEIQSLLVQKFSSWVDNMTINRVLWETSNGPLMMEISRQSMMLPMSLHETIKRSMELYKSWLTSASKADIYGDKLQNYWRQYHKNILLVFSIRSAGAEEMNNHQAVCKQCLGTISYFTSDSVLSTKMTEETWVNLQNTFLTTVYEFVNRIDKSPQEQGMIPVADQMFQTLFFSWIKSEYTSKEMWAEFQKKAATLVHWRATVQQWKEKIIQLTYILKDFIYANEVDLLATNRKVGKAVTTIPRDPKLDAINWNVDRITEVWFIMLDILGNLNKIPDGNNFEIAMSCMKETIDLLLMAEQETLNYDDDPPIPVMGVFLPVLLEACSTNIKFTKGMLIVYSTLAMIFLRQHTKPIDLTLLTHYYRALHMGLGSGKEPIVWEILTSARNIFSVGLEGVYVLVPDFLREIDRLFNSALLQNIPHEIERSAITITNSLICFSSHYESLDVPILGFDTQMSTNEIRTKVSSILLSALNRENVIVKQHCLWGICVLISEDLHCKPRKDVIQGFVKEILSTCSHSNVEISQTSLDCLDMIASQYDKLMSVDVNIIYNIFNTLCDNIIGLITKTKTLGTNSSQADIEKVVSSHFYSLVEWLVAGGSSNILRNPDLTLKLTTSIEVGIFGEIVKDKSQDKDKKPDPKKVDPKKAILKTSGLLDSYYHQLRVKPLHNSEAIKEAAEILLLYSMNFYNNFPCSSGPEQIQSDLIEDNEHKSLYFIYNDSYILSLTEVPKDDGVVTRMIIRDSTGRYAWDSKISYESIVQKLVDHKDIVLPISPSSPVIKQIEASNYNRPEKQIPAFSPDADIKSTDMISELLHYLSETHTECLPPTGKVTTFFKPLVPSSSYKDQIEKLSSALQYQSVKEVEKIKETSTVQRKPLSTYPSDPTTVSSFQGPRMLLSHLGFLTLDNMKRFHLVEDNLRFRRSLKDLDKISGRQVLKIGVVYVSESQEDQRAIFRNDAGSKEFNAFVQGLGWSVDLKTHAGFMGGLDPNLSTGSSAPYWANALYEVVFHTVTRIPTVESDPQQIQKKRHIGNDIVHIIWSEHKRDYNPSTITSQFNDAHVIIYPLPNGLFRVQIHRKDKVSFFGPLLEDMVVSKQLLPFLARTTAMNANMNVRYATKGYKRSFTAREEFIKEVVKRYKTDLTFEDFLLSLYPLKDDDSWKLQGGNLDDDKEEEGSKDEHKHDHDNNRASTGDEPQSTQSSAPPTPVITRSSDSPQAVRSPSLTKATPTPSPSTSVDLPPQQKAESTQPSRGPSATSLTQDTQPNPAPQSSVTPTPVEQPKPQPEPTPAPANPTPAPSTQRPTIAHTSSSASLSAKDDDDEDDKKEKKKGGLFGFMKKKKEEPKKEEPKKEEPKEVVKPVVATAPASTPTPTPSSPAQTQPASSPSEQTSAPVEPQKTEPVRKPVGGVNIMGGMGTQLAQELKNTRPLPAPRSNPSPAANESTPEPTEPSTTTQSQPPADNSVQEPQQSQPTSDSSRVLTYEQLKNKEGIEGLDTNKLEQYMEDEEFEKVLGVSKDQFWKQPLWKQNAKKRQLGLF